MGLRVIGIGLGDAEQAAQLEGALRRMGCRADEEWTARLDAVEASWELVLHGPPRPASACGWHAHGEGPCVRYCKSLSSAWTPSTEALARAVRALVWHPLEFRDNPIERQKGPLGHVFEQSVLEALRNEPAEPLQVSLGLWLGEDDGPRYICKVEGVAAASLENAPPWRWWSPLVRTPDELTSHLREALRSRRRQGRLGDAALGRDLWGWGAAGQAGA